MSQFRLTSDVECHFAVDHGPPLVLRALSKDAAAERVREIKTIVDVVAPNASRVTSRGQWEEKVDGENRSYFYNSETGESRWDAPEEAAVDVGWEERFDENSNRAYYYHRQTGEVTWHKPEAAVASNVSPAASEGTWEEKVDPTTGSTYYFNAMTGESRWAGDETPQQQQHGRGKKLYDI